MLKYEVIRMQNSIHHTRYGDRHRKNGPSYISVKGFLFWYQYNRDVKRNANIRNKKSRD